MSEVTELTRHLVSIPSHEDETAAGDAIESWVREETDATVNRDEAGNVLARRGSGDESFALVGHHDVVPPANEQRDGESYVVEKRDGRLVGRGTADMKGSVAAMLLAFRDAEPECELWFASFVGEEVGGIGAQHAVETGFVPDYAIVGEGSTNYSGADVTDVVVGHRGRRDHTITVYGEAAHAGEPSAGRNAIYEARGVIDTFAELEFPSTTIQGMEMNGSAVITKIRDGGNPTNEVPHECILQADERTVPGIDLSFETVRALDHVDLEISDGFPPMECHDPGFADTVLDAAASVQDNQPELTLKPHATDAGWLDHAGVACVVCGASEPGEAHTATESVSVDVLERCYEIYRVTADSL